MRLSALAPGKVNLCLFVGERRSDGLHEVVTLLESVSLADELSLSAPEELGRDKVSCPGVEEPNIVLKALEGLRARGWNAPAVRLEITKRVPVAGGMGGGSADAAAALRLAEALEPIEPGAVAELAAELGSDVPSQLRPGVAIGTGAGERIEALAPLAPHAFVIVPLPHQLTAAAVYAEFDRLGLPRGPEELVERREALLSSLSRSGELPEELLVNDLQPAAASLCPDIEVALDAVRGCGSDHAMVSGSGPTVFGLFRGGAAAARAEAAGGSLAQRFLGAASAVPVASSFGHPRLAAQSFLD
jgi:4-diphosphocytidyl-2-C-methyl-D-erythritol kinase